MPIGYRSHLVAHRVGNWGSANSGFHLYLLRDFLRTGLAGTTTLHTFVLPCFPTMLFSPLPFDARLGRCPRRCSALFLLPLTSNFMSAEAAHTNDSRTTLRVCSSAYRLGLLHWGVPPQASHLRPVAAEGERALTFHSPQAMEVAPWLCVAASATRDKTSDGH